MNASYSPIMKSLFLLLFACSVVALPLAAADRPEEAKGKLHHFVALKFKESATKEQITQVEQAFRALKKKIPQVSAFKWGTNISPEKLDKGFTHGFILTFKSEQDRDDYLVHPDHKAFGTLLSPVLADVFVIDFWNRE